MENTGWVEAHSNCHNWRQEKGLVSLQVHRSNETEKWFALAIVNDWTGYSDGRFDNLDEAKVEAAIMAKAFLKVAMDDIDKLLKGDFMGSDTPVTHYISEDVIKALVIEIRLYILSHNGKLDGECVAWDSLKKLVGAGQNSTEDMQYSLLRVTSRKGEGDTEPHTETIHGSQARALVQWLKSQEDMSKPPAPKQLDAPK